MPVQTRSQVKKSNCKLSLSYWLDSYVRKCSKKLKYITNDSSLTACQQHFDKMRILTELYANICYYINEVINENIIKKDKLSKFIQYNYDKINIFKTKLSLSKYKPSNSEQHIIQNIFINQLDEAESILACCL
jgi:hypothetical protein